MRPWGRPEPLHSSLDERTTLWSKPAPRRGDDTYLSQQAHSVELAPMLDDLAVRHAHYVHAHHLHPPACSGDAHKFFLVGAAQEPTKGHLVTLFDAVRLGRAQVGESYSHRDRPPL